MARGLGRGFDALLPDDINVNEIANSGARVLEIKLTDIAADPKQPRRSFSETALKELADSIKQHGVIQPILVIKQAHKNGASYQIVAGERRWRAAGQASLKTIPAIVKVYKDVERLQVALIENLQRKNLNAMESALGMQRLMTEFGLTKPQIAEKIGYDTTTVINRLHLLSLPVAMQKALTDGKLGEGQARSLARLRKQPHKQRELFELIIKNDWSVRRAEQFVAAVRKGDDSSSAVSKTRRSIYERPAWAKSVAKRLGVDVTLSNNTKRGGGFIKINYKSEEELKKLEDFFKSHKD